MWLFFFTSQAQDTAFYHFKKPYSWVDYSPTPNKKRIGIVVGGLSALYAGSMIALDRAWYEGYPRSKFHFFDDSREWNQIDKCGHVYGAYFQTLGTYQLYRWAGADNKKAALIAGASALFYQSSIELLDGFSSKWGASWSDIVANTAGAAFATTQFLVWKEQRIWIKISPHLNTYPPGELQQRAANLYGTGPFNLILKDYNNINFWLSVNPWSFAKYSKFPKWLNFAVGYGAGGMYGGFDNTWTDSKGVFYNRNDVVRYRKFLISIDYDLTRIKTKTRAGRIAAYVFNVFKLPAPALEINTKGEVIFHPCYFLNFEMPVYLKK